MNDSVSNVRRRDGESTEAWVARLSASSAPSSYGQGITVGSAAGGADVIRGAFSNPLDALRDAITDPIKERALKAIYQHFNLPGEQISDGFDIASNATLALRGNVFLAIVTIEEMLMAGIRAMQTSDRIMSNIAAAHAFGFWLAEAHGARPSHSLPSAMLRREREEDESGNHDGISAGTKAMRWSRAYRQTFTSLNEDTDIRLIRNEMQRKIGSSVNMHAISEPDIRQWWRITLFHEMGTSPQVAASVFLANRIKDAATVEQRATTLLYRRYPYRP